MKNQKIQPENRIHMADETPIDSEQIVMDKSTRLIIIGVFVFLIVAGIGTGYLLTGGKSAGSTTGVSMTGTAGTEGKTFGSSDTKTFADTATGTIEKDGIGEEGTHKLIRDGGPSQTACLVSSVLNLDDFVGKKVKVWSTTMDAKTCPWLMDVGRIELQ